MRPRAGGRSARRHLTCPSGQRGDAARRYDTRVVRGKRWQPLRPCRLGALPRFGLHPCAGVGRRLRYHRRHIPYFLNSLTPVTLTADTWVTNHSWEDGVARPSSRCCKPAHRCSSTPRACPASRCACGNPLGPPASAPLSGFRTSGAAWPGYQTTRVVHVQTAAPAAAPGQVQASAPASLTVRNASTGDLVQQAFSALLNLASLPPLAKPLPTAASMNVPFRSTDPAVAQSNGVTTQGVALPEMTRAAAGVTVSETATSTTESPAPSTAARGAGDVAPSSSRRARGDPAACRTRRPAGRVVGCSARPPVESSAPSRSRRRRVSPRAPQPARPHEVHRDGLGHHGIHQRGHLGGAGPVFGAGRAGVDADRGPADLGRPSRIGHPCRRPGDDRGHTDGRDGDVLRRFDGHGSPDDPVAGDRAVLDGHAGSVDRESGWCVHPGHRGDLGLTPRSADAAHARTRVWAASCRRAAAGRDAASVVPLWSRA